MGPSVGGGASYQLLVVPVDALLEQKKTKQPTKSLFGLGNDSLLAASCPPSRLPGLHIISAH